jgi:DNA-binding response OmpR family regulator
MHRFIETPVARILLAEATDASRVFLADNLSADGYDVAPVADHQAALGELERGVIDLVVVDVNGHTLALLDTIRDDDNQLDGTASDVPVIVLTSHGEQLHRVRLLERGADDVIAKPYSYGELRARITAVLRRTAPRRPAPMIVAGDLRVDLHQRQVTVHGQPVRVSDTEYRLLCALGAEPTRVFTRAELMRSVWGYAADARTRTLDTHTYRLRAKLAGATHPLIVTVWGVGLQLLPATGAA